MNFETLINDGTTLALVIGFFSLFVQVVVEVTKWSIIETIPTKVYAFIISELSTVLGILSYMRYSGIEIKLFHVVGCIATGFFVCYVSTHSWEELKALKDRFIRK